MVSYLGSMEIDILKTAISQLGNHNNDSPFPGKYFAGDSNWCSEFVSWVYMQAGYPFTGGSFSSKVEVEGDSGSWMQRSSTRIIKWFSDRNTYIDRDTSSDWYNVTPKPGDYVFIGRNGSNRMHSGIVKYVSCSGTLHTIEGNNAGRPVMEFAYPNYLFSTDNGTANGIVLGLGVW